MTDIDLLRKVKLAMLVHNTKVSEVCYVMNISEWTWHAIQRGDSQLYAHQQRKLLSWLASLETIKPTTPQKRLVVALHRLKMTQGELAEQLGISQSKLSEWKNGRETALGVASREKLMLWIENYEKASSPKDKPVGRCVSVLRHLRDRMGFSLTEMALQIDEPISLISGIEDMTKACPLRVAFKLSSLAECGIDDLFGRDGFALKLSETKWFKAA